MEREIGETFEFEGKTYKVVELTAKSCEPCAFFKDKKCWARSYETGNCGISTRKDKKDIIFKEIKKNIDKNNNLIFNIPDGMEIDVENSNFKKGIIKVKKQIRTYSDVKYYLNDFHTSVFITPYNEKKLIAIDKLMNIARYYNKGWKPDWNNERENKYYICCVKNLNSYTINCSNVSNTSFVYFKNKQDIEAIIYNSEFRDILDAIYKN